MSVDRGTTDLTGAAKAADNAIWSAYLVVGVSAVVGVLGWILLTASAPDRAAGEGWTGGHVLLLGLAASGTVVCAAFSAAILVLRTLQRAGALGR